MDRWTRLGIEAYRTGNREQAQRFFRYALVERPNDIRTWLWSVEVADNDAEKKRCLKKVLVLDPNHVLAKHALENIEARLSDKNAQHVDPFKQADSMGSEPVRKNAAIEIRSTPPFIEDLAQQNANTLIAGPNDTQALAGRKRNWTVIALTLLGLVVLLLLVAWSLHLFGG